MQDFENENAPSLGGLRGISNNSLGVPMIVQNPRIYTPPLISSFSLRVFDCFDCEFCPNERISLCGTQCFACFEVGNE